MNRAVDPRAWSALNPVREFTLFNATDDPVVVMYDGETRAIPPVNVVIYPHPKFDDVCHSAKDSEGNWIPGTLVLRDVYDTKEMGEFGENRSLWSAANAIKHSLGIDVRTGQATGDYAKRGLSVLPLNPEPELVQAVRADGRARYEEWRLREAHDVVVAYDEKNAARARVNMQPAPPGLEYQRAVVILQVRHEKDKLRASQSMEAYDQTGAPTADSEDLGEEAAQDAEAPLDQRIAKLLENPEALRILKEQHKMWPMAGKKKVEV